MKIILPIPPSVNELYSPRRGGGLRKSDKYKSWLTQAGQFYLYAKRQIEPVRGPYTMVMRVPATMRGDVDNRAKAALDFLKNVRLTDDDRHCTRATVERDQALTIYAEVEVNAA